MITTNFLRDDVDFHKTFTPQEQYISKILELAKELYSGNKEEISKITGIPTGKTSGKVIPHIRYAKYFGLIDYVKEKTNFSLSLTPLGKIVFEEDKYLFEKNIKLMCHYNIADKTDGAPIWVFLYHALPFRFDEEISFEMVDKRKEDFFGRSDVKLDVVRKAYSDEFMRCTSLMTFDKGLVFVSQIAESQYNAVYAYLLLNTWEKYLPKEKEITVNKLIEDLAWGKRLGFQDDEMMLVLDELADEGYISLNKQLYPCTVIKMEESENLLNDLYRNLL